MSCGTYRSPPLRIELQTAIDQMHQTGQFFAFAVCPTWDGTGWEVNTKTGNIFCALEHIFDSNAEAMTAGTEWLHKALKAAADAK